MEFDPQLLKELIETFQAELEEQLQIITDGLLALEKSKHEDKEKITKDILRATHNIKGTARSLGINNLGDIAHHMEDLIHSVLNGQISISSELINMCFEGVDKIRIAMNSYIEKKEINFDLSDLLKRFKLYENKNKIIDDKNESSHLDIMKYVDEKNYVANNPHQEKNSIRVSIENIDRLSSQMEDLQVYKNLIYDHYIELNSSIKRIKSLSKNLKQHLSLIKNTPFTETENFDELYTAGLDCCAEIESLDFMQKNMQLKINEFEHFFSALQDQIRTIRLVPISFLLERMPRYIRDLSNELNKKIELSIIGGDVKIDKVLLEKLNDPIIHLLRNAVDHGIEAPDIRLSKHKSQIGHIKINIRGENNQIIIKISDDGAGIDENAIAKLALEKKIITNDALAKMNKSEILDLLFMSGFSTKQMITDISGRGVGLDIVKNNLIKLKGKIRIQTEIDKGTTFELVLPITLASERGLIIMSADQLFVMPTSAVIKVNSIHPQEILQVEGGQALLLDNHPVPFQSLANLLGIGQSEIPMSQNLSVLFIKTIQDTVALFVDKVIGEREMVIKPFDPPLEEVANFSGGSLSGNNQIIVVLNPNDIIDNMFGMTNMQPVTFKKDPIGQEELTKMLEKPHVLVVDDSITTRTLEKNILESKNYKVTVAVNGKEALELLKKTPFSLVITDVNMPIMDGFTLTEQLKQNEQLRHIPVIIVTSLGSEAEKKRGVEVGADAYIVKNEFESSKLLDIVAQLV